MNRYAIPLAKRPANHEQVRLAALDGLVVLLDLTDDDRVLLGGANLVRLMLPVETDLVALLNACIAGSRLLADNPQVEVEFDCRATNLAASISIARPSVVKELLNGSVRRRRLLRRVHPAVATADAMWRSVEQDRNYRSAVSM